MKLALIGSRDFNDYESFEAAILKVLSEEWKILISEFSHIVSGGAKGADSLAERKKKFTR
jgi:predicted Rossmann fold nucleotide-binding protein DprA/Smf involved in DNA uptake